MRDFPELLILRHGETEWNATGRLQGSFDSTLTPEGVAQAARQRALQSRLDLTGYRAISSPQGRAFRTAALALDGLIDEIHTDDRLREIGLGTWAGRDRAELMAETGAEDGFALYELAPGGEGFGALARRCEGFLADLTTPAIVVTHGITSRMLRLLLTGSAPERLRDMGGGQGVVYRVSGGRQELLS